MSLSRRFTPMVPSLEPRRLCDGDLTTADALTGTDAPPAQMDAPSPDPAPVPNWPDGLIFSPDPTPDPDPYASGPEGDEPAWIDDIFMISPPPVPGPGPVAPY